MDTVIMVMPGLVAAEVGKTSWNAAGARGFSVMSGSIMITTTPPKQFWFEDGSVILTLNYSNNNSTHDPNVSPIDIWG